MFVRPFSCAAHNVATAEILKIVRERAKRGYNVVEVGDVFLPFDLFALSSGKLTEINAFGHDNTTSFFPRKDRPFSKPIVVDQGRHVNESGVSCSVSPERHWRPCRPHGRADSRPEHGRNQSPTILASALAVNVRGVCTILGE